MQRIFTCPTCKSDLDRVICTKESNLSFSDFNIWGDSIGPDFTYDERAQIFFPNEYYKKKVQMLWLCKCNICSQVKRDLKGLKTHVKLEHNLDMCALCLEHRQSFPSEHKYYNQKEYEVHLKSGDKDGSEGHPNCEFCRKRYYDKTALFTHLTKDHFSCHICTRQGILYKYYSNYENLELHFRSEHYICEDQKCLEKKFVVFVNSIDLAAHNHQFHPLGLSQVLPCYII